MACSDTCMKMKVGNNTQSHCGNCHQTFAGMTAFDSHFNRDSEGRVVCPEITEDFGWKDDQGVWHKGEKMTREQIEAIWG